MSIEKRLEEVMSGFGCQTATLHRAEDGQLYLLASIGVPDSLMGKISQIPFGKGIAGAAAAERKPIELCNLQQDLGGVANEDARKTGVSGSIAVPIEDSAGEVLGTIGIGKRQPYVFPEDEIQKLIEASESFIADLDPSG